jgi:hypothetical protein
VNRTMRGRRTWTRCGWSLETDHGVTTVEGAVILDRPRLMRVDGIACEAPLDGHLTFMKNQDVPGCDRLYRYGVLGQARC